MIKEHEPDEHATMATGWGEKIHESQNHIMFEIEGTSGGLSTNPSTQAGSPIAPCPGGFYITSKMETPRGQPV